MEKGGLTAALRTVDLRANAAILWADELRIGLRGQVRRVWAPRGVKVRQRLQLSYVWRYLALAVDGVRGTLHWRWQANMKKESTAETVREWQTEGVAALVWDNAPNHRAGMVREVGMPLVGQPPYAPELNPAERVFEELRKAAEGVMYDTLDSKVQVIEEALRKLAAHPEQVRRLAGWSWVKAALAQLPD